MQRSRWAKLVLALALVVPVAAATNASVQGRPQPRQAGVEKSYVVVMAAEPLVISEGQDNLDTPRARNRGQQMRASHTRVLQGAGAADATVTNEYTVALNGFSALLTPEEAAEIQKQPDVAAVLEDVMRQPTTDASGDFLGLTAPGGPYASGYTGEDVIVGVIDTGVWPEHPSFADDGSYGPVAVPDDLPCEFGNTADNPNDAPFTCNNKLLGARQTLTTYRTLTGQEPDEFDSARDDNGHGTHTASTAAGNAGVSASILGIDRGVITGIAPRARVIAYKGLGNLGGYTSDLAAAINQAVADGVDVINYSIGGGASLNGADEIAFLFAASAGVFVATSAGNSGPGAGTVGGPGSVPWITTVGASTQSRFFQGTVTLGNGQSFSGASITHGLASAPLVDAAKAGGELCLPNTLKPGLVKGKIVLCKRGQNARVEKGLSVYQAGGVGMILYAQSPIEALLSDTHWVPSVHVSQADGLAIKSYIAAKPAKATASIVGEQVTTDAPAPYMTDFSSRGPDPVALDVIKPDITAPGTHVLAGASPFPDAGSVTGQLFQAIQGTSMSSPHVAGIYALLKQAHPEWSAATAKSAIMTTASQDVRGSDRVTPANPFEAGAGHLDRGGSVAAGSMFEPGLAYDVGFNQYLGFLCDAEPSVFANPAATCANLAAAGIPTEAENLNLASIGVAAVPGSATVTRTVTSVAAINRPLTYAAVVDAPAGFDVTVSPSELRLRAGESATFEVTFTATGAAAIGQWAFGSLTWEDEAGDYSVRSPIAVRAAQFAAPAELDVSGSSGSTSFDVRFGYSGAYSATGLGPVPNVSESRTVVQDPDQEFDRNDGLSQLHTFNLSSAAFFRVAIPPEATEADADLDVFVYDPAGQLVASSTLGGTDEQVDIEAPADGAWSVYVHGWAAPGGDSPYTLSSWTIPSAPGALEVAGAPTAVQVGDTATLTASWNGLGTGSHLAAVSHNGATGPLGLTLVDISVP